MTREIENKIYCSIVDDHKRAIENGCQIQTQVRISLVFENIPSF